MYRRFAPLVLVCSLAVAAPVAAQDQQPPTPIADAVRAIAVDANTADAQPAAQAGIARPKRPGALVPLYISYGALQAMDIHSTTRALNRGAVEANPLMKPVAGNKYALSAVKVAGSAATIYAAEKMWKKNKKAAVIFMVAANVGMGLIVQHNYRAVR